MRIFERTMKVWNLGRRFSTYEQNVVVFWLGAEILEYTLFPEALHVVPILDLTVFDGVVEVVRPRLLALFILAHTHPVQPTDRTSLCRRAADQSLSPLPCRNVVSLTLPDTITSQLST
jgi:hypothetical protein